MATEDVETMLPVITLYQPWATWVMVGLKTIETRTHDHFASLVGKRIGIHAGKRWDPEALTRAEPYLPLEWILVTRAYKHAEGALIATAQVSAHRILTPRDSKRALCDCSSGRLYGLFLKDIKQMVPVRFAMGHQGIFYLNRSI